MVIKPTELLKRAVNRKRESKRHIANAIRHMQEYRAIYSDILSCVEITDNDIVVVDEESIIFCLYELDSMKDERLLNGLSRIMDLHRIEDRGTHDYAGSMNRDFKFRMDYIKSNGEDSRFYISLNAYVSSDSKTCRRVKTGVVEHAVYELVCD